MERTRSESIFCWPRARLRREECFPELLLEVFRALEELVPADECRFVDAVEVLFLAESWPEADTTSAQLRASAQTAPNCLFRIVVLLRTILQPSSGKEEAQPEEPAL
jgi:hypothetical protein